MSYRMRQVIGGAWGGNVYVWEDGDAARHVVNDHRVFSSLHDTVTAMAWHPPLLAAADYDGCIMLYDLRSGER
jgi:WD40 repeat protein